MKSKDLQNIVFSKHQQSATPTEIHRHLDGGISLATIKNQCQMIYQSGSVPATRYTCCSSDSQN